MSVKGIDISHYQPNVNYDAVINDGVKFAILAVGFGVQYLPDKQKDKQFENHYKGFHGRIPVGIYYYSYAKNIGDGKKEAENCLKYLGGKALDLPIFYDVEDKTMNHVEEVTREFVDTIKAAGYKPGVYTYENWTKTKINLNNFKDCMIWIASYGTNNGEVQERYKPTFSPLNIWQYTSKGHVNGINGNVDMNIMYDDVPEPTLGPTPTPTPTPSGDETIRNIQKWCNTYGTGIAEDGYYGPQTKKAIVKVYQTELNKQYNAGLVVDGIFGTATKSKTPVVKQGAKGNITKAIQAMLYCKGYDTNGVDGIYGSGTAGAVKSFQKNNGLSADSIFGKNTAAKLFI